LRELFDELCASIIAKCPSLPLQSLPLPLSYRKVEHPTYSQTDGFVIFLAVFCESSRGSVAAMKCNLAPRVVIFGSMLTAAATIAQPAAANPLTVSEAVSEALKNNPELHGLAADVAATKGEIVTARTFPNPELTVDPGARQTQGPGGSRSDFHANFALSQLFEFPGKRALKITLAERDLTIRRIALEGFRFQLSTEVRRAFFDLLAADKIVGSRNEQVESARVFSPPHGNVRTEGTRQNLKQ
jgi:outer membrane protein TolC